MFKMGIHRFLRADDCLIYTVVSEKCLNFLEHKRWSARQRFLRTTDLVWGRQLFSWRATWVLANNSLIYPSFDVRTASTPFGCDNIVMSFQLCRQSNNISRDMSTKFKQSEFNDSDVSKIIGWTCLPKFEACFDKNHYKNVQCQSSWYFKNSDIPSIITHKLLI